MVICCRKDSFFGWISFLKNKISLSEPKPLTIPKVDTETRIEIKWKGIALFMIKIEGLKIDYNDLVNNYKKIIRFAVKSSDVFSVVDWQKRPYSAFPPFADKDDIMKPLEPFIIKKVAGVRNWPGTGTGDNHMVLSVYECSKFCGNELVKLPNFFSPIEHNIPEDICFYRNGIAWLVTVSHEELAFMYNVTKEDILFLEENSIPFFPTTNSKYLLPK